MTYTIREIEKRDDKAVEGVIRACLIEFGANHEGTAWADPDLCRFSEIYNTEGNKYWVAEDAQGKIVGGTGIGHLDGAEGVCELQKMYCLPEARGTGIAHLLMETALGYAKKYYDRVYLETLPNMIAAQKFYEKHGFSRTYEPIVQTEHYACDVRYIKNLKTMLLEKATVSDFDVIYREMEKNFIPEEIRDREDALKVMDIPEYTVYHISVDSERVGFITVWELEDFAFAEHFVIYKKFRNCGYGGKGMKLLQKKLGNIVLEVEHPEDELKARRIAFYKRLGFCQNDYPYVQPSYRKGGEGVPLILMSYPKSLENCENTASVLYKKVYNK